MITKKTNGGNMEIRIKYDQLKRKGLPQFVIRNRLVREFGLKRTTMWFRVNREAL